MKNLYKLFLVAFASGVGMQANAQVQLSNAGVAVVQDFNSFTGSGFQPVPTAGRLDSDNWYITGFSDGAMNFGDYDTTGDYNRGISLGGVFSAGVYAFDVDSAGDYSLGVQPTAAEFSPGTITLKIQNTSGADMNSLTVAYDLYVNNFGSGTDTRENSFNFSHGSDTSSFVAEPSLNYTSPGATDMNGFVANPMSIVITNITIPDNGFYYIRWTSDDVAGAGGRDEFALDNISVTGDFITSAKSINAKPSFSVYPNPSSNGFVTLDFGKENGAVKEVTVYNVIGNVVEKVVLTDVSRHTFDLSSLNAGTYFVQVVSNGTVLNKKILLNK